MSLTTPTLKAELEGAEAERAQLTAEGNDRTGRVSALLPNLERTNRQLVDNLEGIPERHVPRARAALQRLAGGIWLVPEVQQHPTAEFMLDGAQLRYGAGTKTSVVAGACYLSKQFR